VYAELSPARAQRLHRRIAEQAEALYGARALEHAALIAGQYQRGGRLPGAERGGEFALAAAAQAERVAAVDEQARFLRIALELLAADDARRARAEAALGLALVYAKAGDEGLRAVTQAAERLAAQEGAPAAAAYLAEAAEAFWLTGFDQLRAAVVAAQGLRHAGSEHGPTWARLAVIEVMAREAMDSVRPGIPIDTPLRREISQGIIEHLHALGGAAAAETWRIFFAVVFDSRAQALAALPDEPASLAFLGGDYERAFELCRGEEAAAETWGGLRSALLFHTMVHLEIALGELATAQKRLARLEAVARQLEAPPINEVPLAATAATLALCRGDGLEHALAWLERTLPPVDFPPARFFLAPFRALAALCCAWLGRREDAERWLALALPMLDAGPGWAPNYSVTVNAASEVLWLLERREDAGRVERNLRAKTLAPDFRYTCWDARLSLARLCALHERWGEAEAAFAAARAELDEQGARPLRAIVDHDEALALHRRGRPDDRQRARSLLGPARAAFLALGMSGWTARTDALFSRLS
jgi:hypothetical protein